MTVDEELIERALRVASRAHRSQSRKGSDLPYIAHPFAVALLLQQHGWTDPELLAAALLHDVLEDTAVTHDDLAQQFPARVLEWVAGLSEQKTDAAGQLRPWEDRKRDHLRSLKGSPLPVRAIALADKLHNLRSMQFDLQAGEPLWSRFNVPRERVLWYHAAMIEACNGGEPELRSLVDAVRAALDAIKLDTPQ